MKQYTRRKSGFVLVAMGVSVVVLLGALGLALDLGKTFIVRNEAQAFTDAAALAAVSQLNNTAAGVTAAQRAVTDSTNRWNFTTQAFSPVTTEFSTDKITWTNAGTSPATVKYVRVIAPSNSVAMSVLRAVPGGGSSIIVAARSMAGVVIPTSYPQGVFPFAPIAHSQTGPNFGYSSGDVLTLLWPSSVGSNGNGVKMNNLCKSDQNQAALNAVQAGTTSDRGYIQDMAASSIASAIEDDHMDYTVTLGLPVNRTGGVKSTDVNQSIDNRVAQDTSNNVVSYDGYLSGHSATPLRRVVIVPIVNQAQDPSIVLGFAYVFLPPNQPNNPNDSKCAQYIGPADNPNGNLGNGADTLRLIE
jgi:Flp pilus assembly protein TadG